MRVHGNVFATNYVCVGLKAFRICITGKDKLGRPLVCVCACRCVHENVVFATNYAYVGLMLLHMHHRQGQARPSHRDCGGV